jgi:hypothetical protein
MIRIGLDDSHKIALVNQMRADRGIKNLFVFQPMRFRCLFNEVEAETDYPDIIRYKHFYPLLQNVGPDSLVVINECMRSQNRADLTYNCLRHILTQTPHVVVFQRFPLIDSPEDLMILVDLGSGSRFRREQWSAEINQAVDIRAEGRLSINANNVPCSDAVKRAYQNHRTKLFDSLGSKDPHTLPRQLHVWASKARLVGVEESVRYLTRSTKHNVPGDVYRDATRGEYQVFEFCHNYIDMADALTASGMDSINALVLDVPVDKWYFQRFSEWVDRINSTNKAIV